MIKNSMQKSVVMLANGWHSFKAYRLFATKDLSWVESYEGVIKSPYFWMVIFGHLLLLFFLTCTVSFSFLLTKQEPPEADEQKGTTIPAYIYHEDNAQLAHESSPGGSAPMDAAPPAQEKVVESSKNGIQKSSTQAQETVTPQDNAATVAIPNLVSDNKIKKPLLKLLSKATAAKLIYPRSASDFNITGVVKIRFLLFPAGGVTEVTLIKSSGSGVLDDAALTTVRSISPVKGVDAFLQKPEYVEVGIIYQ